MLGDIGCYTLGAVAPLNAMEMTLCMGASISVKDNNTAKVKGIPSLR